MLEHGVKERIHREPYPPLLPHSFSFELGSAFAELDRLLWET